MTIKSSDGKNVRHVIKLLLNS